MCYGNMFVVAAPPGAPGMPLQLSCSTRVRRLSHGGLPTIVEDQTYEAISNASGSPVSTISTLTWTGHSMDWHCDELGDSSRTSQGSSSAYMFEQCCPDNQQVCNQQYCCPNEADVDAEEMLLAAIDMRLRELLQLRDQMRAERQAAAARKSRSAPPAAAVADHTAADPACWRYNTMPVSAASAAAPATEKYINAPSYPYVDPCTATAQQGVSTGPAYAPAPATYVASYTQQKLQELQQIQNTQLALQREFMELLCNGY